jgi:hypothetical protein
VVWNSTRHQYRNCCAGAARVRRCAGGARESGHHRRTLLRSQSRQSGGNMDGIHRPHLTRQSGRGRSARYGFWMARRILHQRALGTLHGVRCDRAHSRDSRRRTARPPGHLRLGAHRMQSRLHRVCTDGNFRRFDLGGRPRRRGRCRR